MAYPLIAPELEFFPNRKRWTRQECARLVERGELTGRYELIDGEILDKMGQNPPHRTAVLLVMQWLMSRLGIAFVQTQMPIIVTGGDQDYNEPEPDISVTTQDTTTYTESAPHPDDLLLVVEVSDSSLQFDLTIKALLYARSGIRDYWVVDVNGRRILVHRDPLDSGYADVQTYSEEETVSLLLRPEILTSVSNLLPVLSEQSR